MILLNVKKHFSATPGGRHIKSGPFSAEDFRDRLLIPRLRIAIESKDYLLIELDGTFGYCGSFLEEAFGGLVRAGFGLDGIKMHLAVICFEEPMIVDEIWDHINYAANHAEVEASSGESPND